MVIASTLLLVAVAGGVIPAPASRRRPARCRSRTCCAISIAAPCPKSSSTATRSTSRSTTGRPFRTNRAGQLRHRQPGVHSRPGQEATCASTSGRCPRRRRTATARSLLGLVFVGVLGFTLYRVTSGRIPALESKTREADPEATTVTFADVAGVDEAKEEVKEIVDFLREPARFSAIGGRIPKGVLLVGPSGHRQDAAGAIDRRRSEGAVSVRERIGLRRDVCRRRRVAHPQAVQGRPPSSVVHHLHRRARRRRPQPRRHLAQPRRARADAQPAARRDGRLRAQPGHRRHRRDQSSRHSRSRRCCGPAASIAR